MLKSRKIPSQEFRNIPIQEALDKGAMAIFRGKNMVTNVQEMIQFGSSRELWWNSRKIQLRNWHFKLVAESS